MSFFKAIFYVGILIVLVIPGVFQILSFSSGKQLNGVANASYKEVTLSIDSFLSSNIQDVVSSNIKNNIGLRNVLIRINNQINYSVFNILNNGKIIALNNGKFIHQDYINSILGLDFLGYDSLYNFTKKISNIQQILEKDGKVLLFVIAPNKAFIYKNSIPKNRWRLRKDSINYNVITKLFDKYKINYIDFNKYFNCVKDTSKYPLLCEYGIHWSGYYSTIVADSIFSELNNLLSLPKPNIKRTGLLLSDTARYYDNDLEDIVNLLLPLKKIRYYYPKIEIGVKNAKKPNCLVIGDSFAESFYGFYPFYDNLLDSNSLFLYYNDYVKWPTRYKGLKEKDIDDVNEFINRDAFLIIETTSRLSHDFAFNFIDELYVFLNFKEISKSFSLDREISNIVSNEELYKIIIDKAKANNISVDEQLKLDIIWIFNQNEFYNQIKSKIENKIKKSEKYYNSIKQKAKDNNVQENSQLQFDIQWLIEQKFKINE